MIGVREKTAKWDRIKLYGWTKYKIRDRQTERQRKCLDEKEKDRQP